MMTINDECFHFVRHYQFRTESDMTSLVSGGNTLNFYNTYIEPHISEGNCILASVSNNTAPSNNARYMIILPTILPKRSGKIYALRGPAAEAAEMLLADNYDFFMTQGSVIDVWVYNATHPTV